MPIIAQKVMPNNSQSDKFRCSSARPTISQHIEQVAADLRSEVVRKTAKEAGYEMQFTVYGRHMDINVPADQIGRYAIDSLKGDVFKAALDFGTTDGTQPGVEASQLASAAMLTEPLNDQHITEPRPTIKANLASMGDVDPKSVEMRISGMRRLN
jgi:hypothetical protein